MMAVLAATAQRPAAENLIVITLDGLRWQEVFGGLDSVLARDKAFNQGDEQEIMEKYWAPDPETRRRKLMPFLWSVIEQEGRIYGNRLHGNQVDNANPYWFSYPGYSEIFCGYVDSAVNSNAYPPNPNTNVLAYIHQQPGFQGKVAAFGAWDAFDRILNEAKSGFPVVCGTEPCGGANPTPREQLLNDMKRDAYSPFGTSEYLDVFTHYAAFEYLKRARPRVLYISYGETDEWAHHGHYRDYLDAAHQSDQWFRDLWTWLQADPAYRGKTALLITTDHGRGDQVKATWTDHGRSTPDSHEMWFAVIGPGCQAGGEIRTPGQYYQQQLAQTLAAWLGLRFVAEHPVAEGVWKEISGK
jgi:hypothetical protein